MLAVSEIQGMYPYVWHQTHGRTTEAERLARIFQLLGISAAG